MSYTACPYWVLYGSTFTVTVLLCRAMTCESGIECPDSIYSVGRHAARAPRQPGEGRITFDVTVNYAVLMEDIDGDGDLL